MRVLVSAGLFAVIALRTDTAQMLELLSRISLLGFIIAAAAAMLMLVPAALRWHFVLLAMRQSLAFARAARLTLIGLFCNQVLPTTVGGDVVRAWLAVRTGVRLGPAARSVLIDRVAGVFMWVAMGLLALPFLISGAGDNPATWLMAATLVAAALAIAVVLLVDRVPLPQRSVDGKKRSTLKRTFWQVLEQAALLGPDARRAFCVPWVHICSLLYLSGVVWIIFYLARLTGASVSFLSIAAVVPPALLLGSFPISFAGWGVREGAMIAALGIVGLSLEHALTISVIFGLALAAGSLPGGLLFLLDDRAWRSPDKTDLAATAEISEAKIGTDLRDRTQPSGPRYSAESRRG